MEALRMMLADAGGGDAGPVPLGILYNRCHAVHTEQDELVGAKDPDLVEAALALLARALSAVESAGVFSSNEDSDDLATADIKYLLLPFYLGALLSAAPVNVGADGASAARLAAVTRAHPALGAFLHRAEQYDMLGVLGRAAAARAASGTPADPATKRTFKVEKFKREKALGAALGALEARRAVAAAQEREDEAGTSGAAASVTRGGVGGMAVSGAAAASSSSALVAAAGAGGGGAGGALEEEDERQLWRWRVELAVLQALDLRAALEQEIELLRHVAAREAAAAAAGPGPSSSDGRSGGGRGRPGGAAERDADQPTDEDRAQLMAKLRSICRDLDGGRKEQMQRNVFRPGHTMPTMTIEEAGEIDHREAVEREARQKRQEDKEAARRAALDSDEEDAEDKLKQRSWDDYRDANPKGAGNSKIRPCG